MKYFVKCLGLLTGARQPSIIHQGYILFRSSLRYLVTGFVSSCLSRCSAWLRIEKVPIWSSLFRFWIRNLKWIRCLVNSRCFVVQTICPKIIRILFRIWSYEFAVKPKLNCRFHEYVWCALATTTARATKTSLAIKMSACFFFNFFAFISVNSSKMESIGDRPYGFLGTAPKLEIRIVKTFVVCKWVSWGACGLFSAMTEMTHVSWTCVWQWCNFPRIEALDTPHSQMADTRKKTGAWSWKRAVGW